MHVQKAAKAQKAAENAALCSFKRKLSIRYAIVDNASCCRTCQFGCETVEAGRFWTFWSFLDILVRIKAEQASLEHVQRH